MRDDLAEARELLRAAQPGAAIITAALSGPDLDSVLGTPLAGTVGLLVRLIVADLGAGPVCLVNPALVPAGSGECMEEGCLSLPGVLVEVERAGRVEVRGLDPTGRPRHFEARGLLARVLQHEVDHLDGVLIIDRARPKPGDGSPGKGLVAGRPARSGPPCL